MLCGCIILTCNGVDDTLSQELVEVPASETTRLLPGFFLPKSGKKDNKKAQRLLTEELGQ